MPSRTHQFLAIAVPKLRRSRELESEPAERARVEALHRRFEHVLPTRLMPGFNRHWSVRRHDIGFPSYVLQPRRRSAVRTIYYVHGGGYMAPIDPFHVVHATKLAAALDARVVMPEYPLAPEHTWRDSHDALVADAARWADEPGGMALVGDSAGGGLLLAMAQTMRDRGLTPATHLVMHAPWVDLTTSTPETRTVAEVDPWLFLGKLEAYASWWAGSPEDLGRPEVSPALGDLTGLPQAMQLYGTRDLLMPGCRLLAERAAAAGWDLTSIEEPDLIHVYGLLPFIPEAEVAFGQIVEFLRRPTQR